MNCNLEKLLSIIDIWENIFQYFNIKEQLHLTHVCWQFHHIMKSLVWKTKCKELKLYTIEEDTNRVLVTFQVDNVERYIAYTDPMYKFDNYHHKITDVSQKSSILLSYEEVEELLGLNLDNVKKLQIIGKACERQSENQVWFLEFLLRNDFPQLRTLNLFGIKSLSADTLHRINLCCPQLESLILNQCLDNGNGVLQDQRGISAIASMKSLKTLIVTEQLLYYKLKDILNVIRKLQHITQLVLKINIFAGENSDDGSPKLKTLRLPQNLCQLISIYLEEFDYKILPEITKSLLVNFVNLRVLTINGFNKPFLIKKDIFENLTKNCKNLKNLYLEFCEIENFIAIPSLETLTLSNCCDLTWMELKSILSQQNLQSFTSIFTRFSDNFKHFYIESPLEYLRIETMEYDFRDELKELFLYNCQKFNKLNTFIWHDYTMWYLDEPIAMYLPLKGNLHNLKSIFIDLSVIAMDDILEMKCLKQLGLVDNEDVMNLDKFITIFKHSTLETLALYTRNDDYRVKISINESTNYKINIRSIQIPLSLFNKTRNIWLNLLFANPKLQLVCYFRFNCNDINGEYFKELIENPNFPVRIKSVKICDIIIDCNDLKENPDTALNSIKAIAPYYDSFKETMHLQL